jgi:hypothetical protein
MLAMATEQMEEAAKAGIAPADVNMIAQVPMLRGQKTQLWVPLDLAKIPNHKNLIETFVHKYPDVKVDGIGAASWYITLVSNTKTFPEAPKSWGAISSVEIYLDCGGFQLISQSTPKGRPEVAQGDAATVVLPPPACKKRRTGMSALRCALGCSRLPRPVFKRLCPFTDRQWPFCAIFIPASTHIWI